MIDIKEETWVEYIERLRRVNDVASTKVLEYLAKHPIASKEDVKLLIDYAFGVTTKYGEAAAELACLMYDAIGAASGMLLEAAEPASVATYGDVASSIQGTLKRSMNPEAVAASVSRLVKMAGADTTLKNGLRDGAEFAWIPHGDTCAYCIALASNGWRKISRDALKGGHAEHIHANCDCTYGVRFNENLRYIGYNPDRYRKIYDSVEGTGEEKINAMRRKFYAQNKEQINEQKRSAYAKSKELESSAAEEMNVD